MPQNKSKILIIDYEPRGIKQMYEPLRKAGYETLLAKDGIAGFETFEKEKPDLVLIEAMLPKRHGFEVCLDMKRSEHGAKTPVIIVTSVYKGRRYRTQALHQYKCDEYMEKPLAEDKLLETVKRLLPALKVEAVEAAPVEEVAPPVAAAPVEKIAPPVAAAPVEKIAPPVAAAPKAVAGPAPVDPDEEEISDRLNEILFGSEDSDDSKRSA